MIGIEEYNDAIKLLKLGIMQLKPDGNCCLVCGDDGHQAWECHHNPIVQMRRAEEADNEWRCFHCGAIFTNYEDARKHFGNIPTAKSKCVFDNCLCLDCTNNPSVCQGK